MGIFQITAFLIRDVNYIIPVFTNNLLVKNPQKIIFKITRPNMTKMQ
jgi:hypothetical protein